MTLHFFTLSVSLLTVILWMVFLAIPLIWVNDYLKRKSAETMHVDRETLSRMG